MKQTEIGLIPDDWEVKSLGELFEMRAGGDVNKQHFSYYKSDKYKYKIFSNGLENEGVYGFTDLPRYKGDSITITGRGTVGVSMYRKDDFDAVIRLLVLESRNKNQTNNFFISELINEVVKFPNESTGVPQLTVPQIKDVLIPLPPLPEQQRIAKALSDVDALISTTEKLIQKKKNIKQGAMQNLLTGKKRLPGFGPQTKSPAYKQTELGLIPDDWEVKKLSEFGTFSKGSGISREESNTGEYPAVRYGELYTTHNDYIKSFYSHISYEVASKSKKINKGDLLFTCSGETKEDIGKCVAFIGNEKAYAGGDLLILSPTVNIDSLFYGFLLNTTVAVKQKSSMAQGDAVVHISAESIGKIRVPFPSKEEQTSIANVLSSMDKEIETLNTKLEKYRNLKTAMMQQLLTGKIRL
ncbi:restriction endonuclease subunit S [uncultured Treponema sp.]|uniref:restriction endonuclease subunit S n=1 Tax=uncultured Treponema sp. TaxID=162155 RepID=UPI00259954E9|nr:restriction endonuclease subunit S [uncultured Treponema sp.]